MVVRNTELLDFNKVQIYRYPEDIDLRMKQLLALKVNNLIYIRAKL
jgi:hypothetical protein